MIKQILLTQILTSSRQLLPALVLTFVASSIHAEDVVLDEITAVVNEGVVLRSEVAAEALFLNQQAKAGGQNLPQDDVLKERVLERLISQEIQRQRAQQLGIEIDQASVNDAIDEIAAGNNMQTFEFRQTLQNEGFNYDYYRKSIEHELLLSRLIQRDVEQSINVSDQEIDEFLTSSTPESEDLVYRLRHILIAVPSSDSDANIAAARTRMEGIVTRIKGGADFAKIAAAESDGRNALEGGDLGWRKLNELPRFLHDVVKTTANGSISAPVQSQDGFHLVLIEDQQTRIPEAITEARLRHIFVADSVDGNSGSARQTLAELRKRISAGESFAKLASDYSQDPNSAENGGELPWGVESELPTEMQKIAASLQTGTISEPFKTRFGWHIMEVLERRTATATDTKRRREAEINLRQRKLEQETERWSRRLRGEAFVEIKS